MTQSVVAQLRAGRQTVMAMRLTLLAQSTRSSEQTLPAQGASGSAAVGVKARFGRRFGRCRRGGETFRRRVGGDGSAGGDRNGVGLCRLDVNRRTTLKFRGSGGRAGSSKSIMLCIDFCGAASSPASSADEAKLLLSLSSCASAFMLISRAL